MRIAIVATVLAAATLFAACSDSGGPVADTEASEVTLTDAETVWCDAMDNGPAVTSAIMSLKVNGYEEVAETWAEKQEDGRLIGSETAGDTWTTLFVDLEWRPDHEAEWFRACKAAYESR